MENENVNVTGGEQVQANNDLLIQKASEILNAINAKNEKNEKSIISDNVKQFSDEEGQILRQLIEAQKNKAAEEAAKKANEKDEQIKALTEEVNNYKLKERRSILNNSLASIFDELGIVEDGSKKQAEKLGLTGVDINSLFKEDGTVDNDKTKKIFEDLIADVPALANKKAKIEIKETKHDETDEAMKERQQKRLKKWGLLDENKDKNESTLPGGFKSKLLK
jgi:hypothetical protein